MQNQINTSKIALTKSNLELASLIQVLLLKIITNKQSKKNGNKTLSWHDIYHECDMHAKLNTPDGKVNVVKGSSGDGQYTVKDIDAYRYLYP